MNELILAALCRAHSIPVPETEYRFALPRRWRFDYCWIPKKLALEVQGGLFTRGRHVQGTALLREHEKLNEAAIRGWRILYCQPKDIGTGAAFAMIRRALALAEA